MIGYYNYTVILTYMGLVSAVFGIFLSIGSHQPAAVFCLLLSGFFDLFDGKVARTMKRTRSQMDFGIQIDSLCDLVAFGVLPAVIAYNCGVKHVFGMLLLSFYVLCGLIRLAFFNVQERERQTSETEVRKNYFGLPITSSAIILPICFLLKGVLGSAFIYFLSAVLLVTAVLFITPFTVRKPRGKWVIALCLAGVFIVLGILLGCLHNVFGA